MMVTFAPSPQAILAELWPTMPPPRHEDVRRQYARYAAQQNAAPAVGPLQILCADLHGHAPGDFAHRRKQRQRTVPLANGFVGNRADTRLEQRIGQFG